jgi:hypothetical protein
MCIAHHAYTEHPALLFLLLVEAVACCDNNLACLPACNLQQEYVGIVAMYGVADAAGKPVLMLSCAREPSIRLLELPAFTERGVLPDVSVR